MDRGFPLTSEESSRRGRHEGHDAAGPRRSRLNNNRETRTMSDASLTNEAHHKRPQLRIQLFCTESVWSPLRPAESPRSELQLRDRKVLAIFFRSDTADSAPCRTSSSEVNKLIPAKKKPQVQLQSCEQMSRAEEQQNDPRGTRNNDQVEGFPKAFCRQQKREWSAQLLVPPSNSNSSRVLVFPGQRAVSLQVQHLFSPSIAGRNPS